MNQANSQVDAADEAGMVSAAEAEPYLGRPVVRVDARSKVTGQADFPADLSMPGMLHAQTLFAGRPHARVLSIDATEAEALDGVVAVLTAKDVPINEYGLQTRDQPVLCGPGSSNPEADTVRFVGDQIALIVAETARVASDARDLIRVTFDDLPTLSDPFDALNPEAVQIHPLREPNPTHPELSRAGNLISHHQIRRGDMEAGWQQADVVVEGEYFTPAQEHAFLQPESGIAYIDEKGRITVAVAGQWVWEEREQIAHALGLPSERVRVLHPAVGGAFGGREDISIQIVLALAAWKLERPVRMVWTREESIRGHCKRHPMWFSAKLGADKDGKLVAARVRVVADGGAYCYTTNKVLGNTAITCTGPYEIPNASVDVDGVYTNNIPSGAFRGFGAPQGHFVAETQMNKLATALGMDPVELRMRNLLREGSITTMGTPLPGGVSLAEVTECCAGAAGWRDTPEGWQRPETKGAGLGFAVAFKNIGFSFGYQENCWARIELRGSGEIDEAVVNLGAAEVGQGSHTAIQQMAAQALGMRLDRITLRLADTATSPGSSGSASASRMTFMAGNAILGAAQEAMDRWAAEERPAIAEYTYLAPKTTTFDPETGHGVPNLAYGYVAEAVEANVDSETGELHIKRVVCADDVGKAVNPQMIEGQIDGGIAQAVGWATCENFISTDGRVLTPHLSTYLIPTISDVPDIVEPVIVERPSPIGPWGVRGMGEMPFLPLAPALVAAVHDQTGVWIDRLPLTAERVHRSLAAPETG